jgi:hypothetical protein
MQSISFHCIVRESGPIIPIAKQRPKKRPSNRELKWNKRTYNTYKRRRQVGMKNVREADRKWKK